MSGEWGFYEPHTKRCAETLHSCWLGFLFPDAFLPQSHHGDCLESGPTFSKFRARSGKGTLPLPPHSQGGGHLACMGCVTAGEFNACIFLDLQKAVLPGPASLVSLLVFGEEGWGWDVQKDWAMRG